MAGLALVLFLAAAAGGLIMAIGIFRGRRPPLPLAALHGAAAATGLILLAILWLGGQANTPMVAGLAILALAALGGFFLLSFHLRDKPHPKAVVALHALLAISGVVALLIGIL
jgi:hypothetical protein